MKISKAIEAINKNGSLLVFPINNSKDPKSLWFTFYPRSEMRWEWDNSGDNRVANLWHLREELSRSQKVVYSKWYKGRATFFSIELFEALLKLLVFSRDVQNKVSSTAKRLLDVLDENSPISTKELKKLSALKGKANENAYTKALKELWDNLLIVGFGEIDDGAFPSLAIGTSKLLFDKAWQKAHLLSELEARAIILKNMPEGSLFRKEFERIRNKTTNAEKVIQKKKTEVKWSDLVS